MRPLQIKNLQPALLTTLVYLTLAGGSAAAETGAERGSNLLLITADTLRPDALGWISGRQGTPHLDRLAREGFRFPAAISPAPLTLPAHTSIFTGLDPRRHGVRDNGRLVGADLPLMTETLRQHGYATAAFVSGFPLQEMFGLGRGFDHYDDVLTEGDGAWLERPAAATAEAAAAWMTGAPEPWFVWVHFYDPHLPYTPPPGFEREGGRGPYDGEVAGMDLAIGNLLAAASTASSLPRLTVFTADHGESLGEHGEASHGYFIYDSTMLVPMVWHSPGRVPTGESRAAARLADIAPTILDLLEMPALDKTDGISLEPSLEGLGQELPPAYLETWQPWISYGWSPLKAVRHGDWKLIAAPRPELYDLANDPRETNNLLLVERRRARELKELLDAAEADSTPASATVGDPEVLKRLSALGYLGAGRSSSRELPAELADPKDRLELRQTLTEADELLRSGKAKEAIGHFDEVLAEDPDNRFALSRSGEAMVRTGDFAGAIARLRRVASLDPDQPEVRSLLAEALMRSGQFEASASEWMELVRLQPGNAVAWSNLGAALGRSGKLDRAIEAMTRAVELSPGDPGRLTRLAFAEHAAGRTAEAVTHLEEAAALQAEAFAHFAALGLLQLRLDRLAAARASIARSRSSEAEFPEAHLQLARAELAADERESAAETLARLLAARPDQAARVATDPALAPLVE